MLIQFIRKNPSPPTVIDYLGTTTNPKQTQAAGEIDFCLHSGGYHLASDDASNFRRIFAQVFFLRRNISVCSDADPDSRRVLGVFVVFPREHPDDL